MSNLRPNSEPGIAESALLDALSAAVIVTDGSGRIVQWNSTTTAMFGWLGDHGPRQLVQVLLASSGAHRRTSGGRIVPLTRLDGTVAHYSVERADVVEASRALAIWTVSAVELDASQVVAPLVPGRRGDASAPMPPSATPLLADLDAALGACRVTTDVLEAVPGRLVPAVADWCALVVVADDAHDVDRPRLECNAATVDAALDDVATPWCTNPGAPVAVAMHAAVADRFAAVGLDAPDAAEHGIDEADRTALRAAGIGWSLVIPLTSGGPAFGALHLLRHATSGAFSSDEVSWLSHVAVRIAATLGPLREGARGRDLALTFQEALLPDDFPQVPALDVVSRHRPGSADLDVGGDFSDLVATEADRWALIVGDVCGRGPAAAAQTGRLRHSFRMSAWHGDQPVEILRWLDRALRSGGDGVLCSAVVASLARDVDDTFTFSCALGGHPQPVVCRVDGTVEAFGSHGMLLGTDLPCDHTVESTTLHAGDAVVLYTDGLTDAPPPRLLSHAELVGLVESAWLGAPDAATFADRILVEADRVHALSERRDDIALVVLRPT